MPRFLPIKRLTLLAGIALAGQAGAATVLTFPAANSCSAQIDGYGALQACANGLHINQAVGDAAGIDVQYTDVNQSAPTSLLWWDGGYNELPSALWASGGDASSHARITLLALPGSSITLGGFDLGAWPNTSRGSNLHVYEVGGGPDLYNGAVTIGQLPSNLSTHFGFGATSNKGWVIEWWDSAYNVGLNNLSYEVSAVPEPQSWLLLLGGLGLLASLRRRS